jgi:hypothetical protein
MNIGGIGYAVERCTAPGEQAQCLVCDRSYARWRAVVAVLALGERIGEVGTCCLAPSAKTRLAEECRQLEAAS